MKRQPVSDRSADTFDNASKHACRTRNLRTVQEQAPALLDDDGKLRCGWAELMGETGVKTLELLQDAGVLAAGGFVGIDRDAGRIERFRHQHPEHNWIAGDLLDSLRSPAMENVGVVNFDAYDAVGGPSLFVALRHIKSVMRRSIERFGAAVICVNADLDAARLLGIPYGQALRAHVERLAKVLVDERDQRRRLGGVDLLPPGLERHVDDRSWVGQLGACEVYRGRGGSHRMANLRVILR